MLRIGVFFMAIACMCCSLSHAGIVEDTYKEEFSRLTSEIIVQEQIIEAYQAYEEKMTALLKDMGRMSAAEVGRKEIDNRNWLINRINTITGTTGTTIPVVVPVSHDIREHQDKKDQLETKKRDLKMRIVEKLGSLPEWWRG